VKNVSPSFRSATTGRNAQTDQMKRIAVSLLKTVSVTFNGRLSLTAPLLHPVRGLKGGGKPTLITSASTSAKAVSVIP